MPNHHMRTFVHTYMRTLRLIYDAERQINLSMPALRRVQAEPALGSALADLEELSGRQMERLDGIFRVLYREPRGDACWVATALLREAFEAASESCGPGCATALLALKRHELTLYEALLRWSEQCELMEALPALRRCLAEELLQASIFSECAFGTVIPDQARVTVRTHAILQ